jgi:hypothetical protein
VGQFALPDSTSPSLASTPTPTPTIAQPASVPQGRPVAPAPVPAPQPMPAVAPSPVTAGAGVVRPVPDAGYVLPEGRGHFRLSSDGRTIVDFALVRTCAGLLTLPPIDVDATGSFAFAGHPGGSPSGTTVNITGRFVSPSEAHGTAQVSRSACRAPATTFVAHLS